MTEGTLVEVPEKLLFLFAPARYKIAYGGRGGAKSWSFARAILAIGRSRTIRVLCAREIQKSLKDSVKKLLEDQIEELGLGWFWDSLATEIRGRNGSEILFAGLQDHTVESIKSFEGADICWIEEAQSVSKRSWQILTPTIRKAGSEIWVSFNPHLDTDEVWKRFVENPPDGAKVVQINWNDNPWFTEESEQERLHCKATDPENYPNIWEGKCRSAVVGAIYATEVADAISQGRVCAVPYNPKLKVHTIWDMGWNDSMTITLVQRHMNSVLIIGYIEDDHKTLDWYAAELNRRRYNWGYDWLPHDAFVGDYKTGKTAAAILKTMGRRPKKTPNIPVESGIRAARMLFSQCYFDKINAAGLLECLKRYKRSVPTTTGEPGAPVHDASSHGADGFRYLAVVSDMLKNEDDEMQTITGFQAFDRETGY